MGLLGICHVHDICKSAPSLISLIVSVDVKHRVYLLTYLQCLVILFSAMNEAAKK